MSKIPGRPKKSSPKASTDGKTSIDFQNASNKKGTRSLATAPLASPGVLTSVEGSFSHQEPYDPFKAAISRSPTDKPLTILFGCAPLFDEYTINATLARTLPKQFIDQLAEYGSLVEGSGSMILQVTHAGAEVPLMVVRDYLQHINCMPPASASSFKATDQNCTEAAGGKYRGCEKASQQSNVLYPRFMRYVMTYNFAADLNFPEARSYVAAKICQDFPLGLREVISLIEEIYHRAYEIGDKDMVEFIRTSAVRQSTTLIREEGFGSSLRGIIEASNDPIAELLLEVQLSANHFFFSSHSLNEQPTSNAATTPSSDTAGTIPMRPRKETEEDRLRSSFELALRSRPVKAIKSGHGTLLLPARTKERNEAFIFKAGEVLLEDRQAKPKFGQSNIIVVNSLGQRGDVRSVYFTPMLDDAPVTQVEEGSGSSNIQDLLNPVNGAGEMNTDSAKRTREDSPHRIIKSQKTEDGTSPLFRDEHANE